MSKLTFYIVRHGKTLMNTLDMVQGFCDSPLTEEGKEVAKHLGLGLKDIPFRSIYCSTLNRTKQTAEIIIETKGQGDKEIIPIDGFKESCFGSFEAGPNQTMWGSAALFLQYTSLDEMFKDVLAKKIHHRQVLDVICKLDKMGIAENYDTLEKRTQQALKEVAEKESKLGDGNILIVAHGMSILGMLNSLGGEDILEGMLENASVCKVTYEDGTFNVESMGDLSYVEKGRKALQ